jgi:hypothetical protein
MVAFEKIFKFHKVISIAFQLPPQNGYLDYQISSLQSNMDNYKIKLQFGGDIKWNHIIYNVNKGKFVSNKARYILIVRLKR